MCKKKAAVWPPSFENRLSVVLVVHGTKFARKEMVRWPRSAHGHFTILELASGRGEAILIFLNGFAVDEMGDVEHDAAGLDSLTTDLLLERRKQLVDLHGKRTCLGLTFAFTGGSIP